MLVTVRGDARMNSRWKEITLAMMLATSSSLVVADTSHTRIEETRQRLSSPDTTPLTATDRARANAWGLSEQEWRRYKTLMRGIRGSISPPTISPIEVLGIHARDWASAHEIDPKWVRSRRITLNHDAGALEKLTKGEGKAPYLLRRRGDDLAPIRASDL